MNRRQFLTGVASAAVAAALPDLEQSPVSDGRLIWSEWKRAATMVRGRFLQFKLELDADGEGYTFVRGAISEGDWCLGDRDYFVVAETHHGPDLGEAPARS